METYTTKELASIFKVNVYIIRKWVKKGILHVYKKSSYVGNSNIFKEETLYCGMLYITLHNKGFKDKLIVDYIKAYQKICIYSYSSPYLIFTSRNIENKIKCNCSDSIFNFNSDICSMSIVNWEDTLIINNENLKLKVKSLK